MTAAAAPGEATSLAELRLALAPHVAAAAVFDGWSRAAVEEAAGVAGVDPALAALAFPGGAMDMIEAWIATVDAAMVAALPATDLARLPVRERIRSLVAFRIGALAGREEALVRAQAVMAMPANAARTARLGWRSADLMWRLAGDTATDYNHYTKRTILAAVYAATLGVLGGDESPGKADTHAFLDRRIDGIIRFEKAKARLLPQGGDHFSLTRFLGRLRYPAR